MKKAIFVDRDGTIIVEPEITEQVDSLEKLSFVPGAISGMKALMGLGYEIVLASNQDGLGTESFPEETFWPAHNKMLETLRGEGVKFDDILIDPSRPEDHSPNRKPGTGMFGKYMDGSYDLTASFVIGDRDTDMQLAENLGARGVRLGELSWPEIVEVIRRGVRTARVLRKTSETDIDVFLDLDGGLGQGVRPGGHWLPKREGTHEVGRTRRDEDPAQTGAMVDTGLKFFDHMLEQLNHHGGVGLRIKCKGDLEVDEHHTMEDVGIALGEAFKQALGDKVGIERYGFALPMDESAALVLLDFGGRSELVWDVKFTREYVGDVPTEMFKHFFKSFCDAAGCNLRIQAVGENNHHIAEAVFKAFARSIRQAVHKNVFEYSLPSSKGVL